MRKIIYYVAVSADGYIARPDGDVGWLDRPEPIGGYGLAAFYKTVDTVILGRKTYDVGRKLGQPVFEGVKNYVFSRRLKRPPHPEVELLKGDVASIARRLRRQKGKDIWLIGGASLVGAFLDAGQLDQIIVHTIPTLIGEGIPLVSPARREIPLTLTGVKRYSDGTLRLSYDVPRRARSASRRRKRRAATT